MVTRIYPDTMAAKFLLMAAIEKLQQAELTNSDDTYCGLVQYATIAMQRALKHMDSRAAMPHPWNLTLYDFDFVHPYEHRYVNLSVLGAVRTVIEDTSGNGCRLPCRCK